MIRSYRKLRRVAIPAIGITSLSVVQSRLVEVVVGWYLRQYGCGPDTRTTSPSRQSGHREAFRFTQTMEVTIVLMTIVIGLIVGAVAKLLTPGRDPGGFLITIALGIGGALLATYGGQALGLYNAGEPAGFIGSVVGAIILLAIYHLITRRSGRVTNTR